MVLVLACIANILRGFLVKGRFASERAEVIGLSFVFGCAGSGNGVDIHVADRIMYSDCHTLSPFLELDLTV
jgi:hypothetical protein